MALATLSIDLVAKLAEFQADLGKAARVTEQQAQRMQTALAGVKTTVAGLAGGFTVGIAVDAFKGVVNGLDALNDLKDATGSSIENISALEDVARRTGGTFETVQTALIKFNAALKEAKPNNDAGAALEAIGLQAEELKRLDPAEALLKTAVALQAFADDGNKARLVQELFGKSLKEVAPLLKDLAEKGTLVATVTTQQAEQAERFNQQLSALAKNSQDAGRAIVSDLLPSLSKALEIFTKLKEQGLFGAGTAGLITGRISFDVDKAGQDINNLLAERTKLQAEFNSTLAYEEKFKGQDRSASQGIKERIESTNKLLAVSRARQLAQVEINKADQADAVSRRVGDKPTLAFAGALKPTTTAKTDAEREAERAAKASASILGDITLRISGANAEADAGKKLSAVQEYLLATVQKLASAETKFTDEQKRAITANLEQYAAVASLNEISAEHAKRLEDLAKTRVQASASFAKYIEGLHQQNEAQAQANVLLQQSLEEIGLEGAALDRVRLARLDANLSREQESLLIAQSVEGNEIEIAQIERRIRLLNNERAITGKIVTRKVEVEASDTLKKVAEQEEEAAKRRTERISQSIEDGLLNGFRNGGGIAEVFVKELEAQFAKAILRPIIDPIVQQTTQGIDGLFKTLVGSFVGGGFDVSQFLGGVDSPAKLDGFGNFLGLETGGGGATAGVEDLFSLFAPRASSYAPMDDADSSKLASFLGFANGGNPPVGVPYWVGERGPELRIDRGPGTIIPNGQAMAMARGGKNEQGSGQAVTVVQNFTVGDVATVDMVKKAVANSQREMAGALQRSGMYA